MKNNKLISILLALLVCLSMVVSASATESELNFTLESDSSVELLGAAVVEPGETITVKVNIASNPGVLAAIAYVEFDSEELELVSAKALVKDVKVPEGTVAGRVSVVVGNTSAIFAPDKYEAVTATGAVAELTFKVLVETDAQISVNLKATQSNAIDANGKFGEIAVNGDVLNVNVLGADHVCDETKTVEANNAVEPNCTEVGKKSDLLCAHCGELVAEGEEIPALGHTAGEVVVENEVASDCVNAGSYDNVTYCTVCKAEVSRETVTVKATGHKAGEKVIENEVLPTCTERGGYDIVTYCTVCNAEVSRISQSYVATGHNWGEWTITTAPGCSTFGVQTRTCTGCGLVEEDTSVPATGEHKFGDWKVTTEATTEAEGEETRTCECGAKETRPIEKLAPQPAPKNNTLVIVIIVVVVLAGAGVAAYFVLKNKKK